MLLRVQRGMLQASLERATASLLSLEVQSAIDEIDEAESASVGALHAEMTAFAASAYAPLSPLGMGWYAYLHGRRHSDFIADATAAVRASFVDGMQRRSVAIVKAVFARVRAFEERRRVARLRALTAAWRATASNLRRGEGVGLKAAGASFGAAPAATR